MTRLIACLTMIIAFGSLQAAQASCAYPPQVDIPDGASATKAEMEQGQRMVKEYMAKVEGYLACLDEEEKALGEAVTDEQKSVHISRHNAAVDALNAVAVRFNEQVQVFKKRQK